jgi:hypothetical protein
MAAGTMALLTLQIRDVHHHCAGFLSVPEITALICSSVAETVAVPSFDADRGVRVALGRRTPVR